MAQPPAGTVTFLFTDIEGSSKLWESSPVSMSDALARHDALVRSAIEAGGGYIFATGGDGFAAAFDRVGDAVGAAMSAQERLSAEPWPDETIIRVRMGLHTGEASERDGDYFGPVVNRAARLMATAHGGQVVCSLAAASLADASLPLLSLGEHRLRDLAAPEQVFQVGHGTFPHLCTVDAVPTNLPTVRSELVGRADEVTTLAEISRRERLVTFTGVGGVGKTRLALGVAAMVAPEYEDGCWLVDLAPLADGADVPMALAAAIGAPVTEGAALVNYLTDRHLLVVLDNCEHVIADVADLVESVLRVTRAVHVFATSREPLGLDGEVVRRVASLAVADTNASPEEAAQAAAVRLFVERANAVAGGFVLDYSNVEPVIEVCRRLDGIPLAIELAAARVRSMPPADLARRLDERFRLLGGGSRRAQERHRTLLATVSWSYDLLIDAEKAVFIRLAVFPASFSLEAAEEVAGRDDAMSNVTDSLLGLVDRSLVQFDPAEGRYRLLETLRQFAADRLGDCGETEMRREGHARYYLDLVEHQSSRLTGRDYLNALSDLTLDLDNLRATAAWCIDYGRWSELARLSRCTLYFAIQSTPVDGVSWRRQIIDHRAGLDDVVVIEVLSELAFLEANLAWNTDDALAVADQAIRLAEATGRRPMPWALTARAMALCMGARYEETIIEANQALLSADAVADAATAVIVLATMSSAFAALGEREQSTTSAVEAWRRAEASGHPVHIGTAAITHAAGYLTQVAAPDFETSWEILNRYPDARTVGGTNAMWFDLFWGWSLLGLGNRDAVEWLTRAAVAADRLQVQAVSDLSLRLLALAYDECGHAKEARTVAHYADVTFRSFRIPAPGQAWIDGRLDGAGIAGSAWDGIELSRREIMTLIAATTFSIFGPSPREGRASSSQP